MDKIYKRKRKKVGITGKPMYLLLILFGLILIAVTFLNNNALPKYLSNLIAIAGNLGAGIFPTGAIGLILDSMNEKNKIELKTYKRQAVLKDFKIMIQNYLNEVCNQYFTINEIVYNNIIDRQIDVDDIFIKIKEFSYKFMFEYGNNQINVDNEFIHRILNDECKIIRSIYTFVRNITNEKSMFIVNEIFSHKEIEIMSSLYEHSVKYVDYIENGNYLEGVQEKMIVISNIQNILYEFEELNQFLYMKYSHYTLK